MAVFDTANTGTDVVKNVPLYSDGKAAVKAASNGDIGSLTADVGSFAMGALGVAADPLNALISAGLGFLEDWCTPVKDCLAQVTGKPEELDKNKEAFTEVASDLSKLGGELKQITTSGFQNWNGAAKDAATKAIDTFVEGVEGTANNATDIASVLSISATLMDAAKEIINGILSTLIEWLIVTWLAALATSWCTFGASDAAAAAATGVEAGVEGANAAEKVEETSSFIERIVKIIKDIIEKLKSFAKESKDFAKDVAKNHKALKAGEDVGKDAEKASGDAGKAAEDAGKAGQGGTETAGHEGATGSQEGGNAGNGDGGGSGNSGDGGSSGESGNSNDDKPNFFQNKWDEAKKGIKDPLGALQEKAKEAPKLRDFAKHMVTPEENGPSPLVDTLMDAGIKGGAKIVGTLDDGAANQENGPDGWGTMSGTIDQDLQG